MSITPARSFHAKQSPLRSSSPRRCEKIELASLVGFATRRVECVKQIGIGAFLIGVGRAALTQLPLPPNRTGGFPASGSPVSGFTSSRIDARRRRLSQEKTAPAPQSRHLASVHGPASTWPDLVSGFASAEDCVSGLVPTRRWVERSSSGCV